MDRLLKGATWAALILATLTGGFLLGLAAPAEAQMNPCAPKAVNPCTPKAVNPCAPKAQVNPCAPGAAAGPMAKGRMIVGQVVSATPGQIDVQSDGQKVRVAVDEKTRFTRGREKSSLATLRPGERIILSTTERAGTFKANFVYLSVAQATVNPCAPKAVNPCAPKANPCAVKKPSAETNPCAPKAVNPCAVTNPCAPKANPCAVK